MGVRGTLLERRVIVDVGRKEGGTMGVDRGGELGSKMVATLGLAMYSGTVWESRASLKLVKRFSVLLQDPRGVADRCGGGDDNGDSKRKRIRRWFMQ